MIQSVVIYFACSIFAVKASSHKDLKWIRTMLEVCFIIFICVFTAVFIWKWVDYAVTVKEICRTIAFVLPELFNCLVSVMFIGVGWSIQKNTNKFIDTRLGSISEVEMSPTAAKHFK